MNPSKTAALIAALVAVAAVASRSAPAAAQTHLSLYGIVDVGFLVTDPSAGPGTRAIASGIESPSHVGVRGVERLTPDLNAIFVLEGGLTIDSGLSQASGRLFGRQAWVSLLGHAGEIRLGRQYGLGYEYFLADASPFGTTFGDAGTGSLFSSASDRLILDNVVMLRSGHFGGGLAGAIGYSFNADGAERAGSGGNTTLWTAGARYRARTFNAAVTYENVRCPAGAAGTAFASCNAVLRDRQTHWQVGGSWQLAPFRLYGLWALEENQFGYFAVTPARRAKVYELGVRLGFERGELLAAYQGRDDDWNANLDAWGLGYSYAWSRRTEVYTFVADTSADDAPTAQLVSGGRVVREGYTAPQIEAYRTRDRLQFGFGLRHAF